jgi:prepilin-type N-terminal cleavage/methylation domain-containing protein
MCARRHTTRTSQRSAASQSSRGFNLVETMVASVILSSAVLTVAAISSKALTATRLNRQYEVAASLIDRQLALVDYIGIDAFVESGQTEGVFEEVEPGYHWEITAEYQGIDSLYLVTITVTWIDRNRPYKIVTQTMFDGISTYATVSTASE